MATRYAHNACREAAWQTMNVFGAMAHSTEAKVQGLYRDMRRIAIADGSNEILALIHGREVTGLEPFRGLAARAAQ